MEATLNHTARKSDKIVFWIFTIIIFLVEAVMPALTFNSDLAETRYCPFRLSLIISGLS
jgi:hypothetical protein